MTGTTIDDALMRSNPWIAPDDPKLARAVVDFAADTRAPPARPRGGGLIG